MNMPVTRKTTATPSTSGHGSLAGALRPKSMQQQMYNSITLAANAISHTQYKYTRQSASHGIQTGAKCACQRCTGTHGSQCIHPGGQKEAAKVEFVRCAHIGHLQAAQARLAAG